MMLKIMTPCILIIYIYLRATLCIENVWKDTPYQNSIVSIPGITIERNKNRQSISQGPNNGELILE